jgi:hypothetical protein
MEAVLSDLLKSVVTSKKVQDALAP